MIDFLLDPTTGDLLIENGDLVMGVSDNQNKALLLRLPKGAVKSAPTATVGAMNYLESEDSAGLLREIKSKFSADGQTVKSVGFGKDDKLHIDSNY